MVPLLLRAPQTRLTRRPCSCADNESFEDGSLQLCSHYRGWGCDDTSTSGGTTSVELKANCPLSCGTCSGEFRQTEGSTKGCTWDGSFLFSECCSSPAFTTAAGEACAYETVQYNACCAERECADDPAFVDEQGYPCADWAVLDCYADHGYTPGGKDALLANCGMSCSSCDKWRGDGNCWSAHIFCPRATCPTARH
eukprot:COSAG04_NODE_1138_length_8106_cov_4.244036_3_plen_196_part_00